MKKRSKSENKGKVPTEIELVLEQTQQDTSYEVSVDSHGFEGYSNQTRANDKAIFVPPRFIANCFIVDSHKDGHGVIMEYFVKNSKKALILELKRRNLKNTMLTSNTPRGFSHNAGNEELSTIPKKESDEFIKSSVEDLIPIPRESEDTSGSDSESVLPSSDDFSPIFEEKSVTFSNPLFDSNDDFTSSDDESLSDEDVLEDVKIYSNPLFEFDDEYISSDVNPLFDEMLKDIECEVSYDSNLDESTFCQTLSII
ncbi:hypothetical protein Tco_0066598 [Tanacetum coccineum]